MEVKVAIKCRFIMSDDEGLIWNWKWGAFDEGRFGRQNDSTVNQIDCISGLA